MAVSGRSKLPHHKNATQVGLMSSSLAAMFGLHLYIIEEGGLQRGQ